MKIPHAYILVFGALLPLALIPCLSVAESTKAAIVLVNPTGVGASIGTVTFNDSKNGLEIDPILHGLPPGEHGFHIHEKGSCDSGPKDGVATAAQAAGGHLDPHSAGEHRGPHGAGHLGDLPILVVNKDGNASAKMNAPRLKVSDLKGRSVIIHASGDNFSDDPKPLGGGGARIACGVIQ